MMSVRSIQRREYYVRDITEYDLPAVPEKYFWKLWIPTLPSPTIGFLELRRRYGVFSEVFEDRLIVVPSHDVLYEQIRNEALQIAVLRLLHVRVHEQDLGSKILLEESYSLWQELKTQLPDVPAQHFWHIETFAYQSANVQLKKRILGTDDSRLLGERSVVPGNSEYLDSSDIAKVAHIVNEELLK